MRKTTAKLLTLALLFSATAALAQVEEDMVREVQEEIGSIFWPQS